MWHIHVHLVFILVLSIWELGCTARDIDMEDNTGCEPMRGSNISSSYVHSRKTIVTAVTEAHRATRAEGKEKYEGKKKYMH